MELAIIGVVVAFNFLVIYAKFNNKRYLDGGLDLVLLATVSILFGGSYAGLVVATIASAIISLYLFFSPPKIKLPKPP
jgi:Na+/proline symporter